MIAERLRTKEITINNLTDDDLIASSRLLSLTLSTPSHFLVVSLNVLSSHNAESSRATTAWIHFYFWKFHCCYSRVGTFSRLFWFIGGPCRRRAYVLLMSPILMPADANGKYFYGNSIGRVIYLISLSLYYFQFSERSNSGHKALCLSFSNSSP